MKYHYFYQSSKNESLDDWIVAKDRNDAYTQLRKRGIKPYKVLGRNPIAWKRWAAIAILTTALVATYAWLALRPNGKHPAPQTEVEVARHQIYGDRSVIENGIATRWAACGLMSGEQHLARYAQPGITVPRIPKLNKMVASVDAALDRKLESADGELTEYRQVKGIIETMKAELRRYKANGGTTEGYLKRLQERQNQEVAFYRAAAQELDAAKGVKSDEELAALWASKNTELRAIGLPMLPDPSEE